MALDSELGHVVKIVHRNQLSNALKYDVVSMHDVKRVEIMVGITLQVPHRACAYHQGVDTMSDHYLYRAGFINNAPQETCCHLCSVDPECNGFALLKNDCYLKTLEHLKSRKRARGITLGLLIESLP